MSSVIRPAQHEDIPAIVAMAQQFYPESGYQQIAPLVPEQAAGMAIITMRSGVCLVAEHDGDVVAMALLHVEPFIFNVAVTVAHELAFWINPEHRGGMLAVRMLKAIEAECARLGVGWVRMATLPGSPAQAAGLYERMGYAPSENYFMKAA